MRKNEIFLCKNKVSIESKIKICGRRPVIGMQEFDKITDACLLALRQTFDRKYNTVKASGIYGGRKTGYRCN